MVYNEGLQSSGLAPESAVDEPIPLSPGKGDSLRRSLTKQEEFMLYIVRTIAVVLGTLLVTITAPWADTIKIGMIANVAANDLDAVNGAKLAVSDINKAGGALGRPIELVVEDGQSTEAGNVSALGKLAARADLIAFIGPDRSAWIHVMAPEVTKTGKPMMIGGTDPKLTHMGNPLLFRCRPNDSYSSKVMAEFGVKTLQRKRWAIVHVNDAFGISAANTLTEELKQRHIEPVALQGIDNTQEATSGAVRFVEAAKTARADLIASYLLGPGFSASPVLLAKQLRQNGIEAIWIGSPTTTNVETMKRAGADLNGAYAVTDFAAQAGAAAEAFAQKYQAAYSTPADQFAAWTFDAVNVLARAITSAGGTEPERLRAAILAIHDYQGAEGTYNFDSNGDGLHGYNVVHNENGRWVFVKRVDF
jgi:branched-chain amino acid transport system substrate-binding protein